MSKYAKIRAALEMSKRASRYCVLPGLERKTDEALAELAERERAASAPVMWQYLDTQHVQIGTPPPSDVWRALYAAPPVPDGMFTAEHMRAAYDEGQSNKYGPWLYSNTRKLVEARSDQRPRW